MSSLQVKALLYIAFNQLSQRCCLNNVRGDLYEEQILSKEPNQQEVLQKIQVGIRLRNATVDTLLRCKGRLGISYNHKQSRMTRNASSRLLTMAVLIFIRSQQQLYSASSTSDYHSNSLSGRGSRDLLLDLLVRELEEVAGATDELLVDIDMGNSALAVEFLEVSLDGSYDKMSQHPTIIHFHSSQIRRHTTVIAFVESIRMSAVIA